MAKQVKLAKGKEFAFASPKTGGAPSKYDWNGWFNPDPTLFPHGLVMLEQSLGTKNDKGNITDIAQKGKRDYEVSTDAMPGKIKTAARRAYKVVQISRYDPDGVKLQDALIVKARDMTAEERVKEDELRAKEEVADKARRDKQKAKASAPQVTGPTAAVEQGQDENAA